MNLQCVVGSFVLGENVCSSSSSTGFYQVGGFIGDLENVFLVSDVKENLKGIMSCSSEARC
jgi:hypothetical protein